MITGRQIRSARAALGWSVQELADRAAVATKTIMRMESVAGVPQSRTKTLLDIKAALEAAGIEFIGTPNDRHPATELNLAVGRIAFWGYLRICLAKSTSFCYCSCRA
jgi:transcriptional regulator with XRE-family HTH domain